MGRTGGNTPPQHFFDFLPLPQGQGSLRPVRGAAAFTGALEASGFGARPVRELRRERRADDRFDLDDGPSIGGGQGVANAVARRRELLERGEGIPHHRALVEPGGRTLRHGEGLTAVGFELIPGPQECLENRRTGREDAIERTHQCKVVEPCLLEALAQIRREDVWVG